MRKLEYVEPFLDLLFSLKEKLKKAKFVFVIGYSFRDKQIQKIFWNAAKINKDLVVILVSPSASDIYKSKLRKYDNGLISSLDGKGLSLSDIRSKTINIKDK